MLKLKRLKVSDVRLDEKNANRGTKRGREFIEGSLKKYGLGRSILLDKDGTVIAGNKTLEEFKAAGGKELLVVGTRGDALVAVQREDLTIDSRKGRSLAIADNRASEIDLDWHPEVLASLDLKLSELFDDNDLRRIMGDLAPKIEAPEPKLDQAAALQKKWKTTRGQIWEIGKHRLMCGDSTSEPDVATLLSAQVPFLCVTDPPYGVGYDPSWRNEEAAKGNLAYAARRVGKVSNDNRTDWTPAWKLFPGRVLYCWHAGRYASTVQQSIENADFEIRSQIIWAKSNFPISRGHYHWRHEPCWYAVRSGATAQWIGDRAQTTLWEINLDRNVDGGHSTQKPLECMARPIRNHDGYVYDPFVGSGTTVCAAELLGRVSFSMDIDPEYVAVSLERLSEMGLKPELSSP